MNLNQSRQSRQSIVLALIVVIGLAALSIAQGPPGALITGQFLQGQTRTGTVRNLVGLNESSLVSIDPGAVGSTFGGTVAVTGNATMAGSLTLTGALVNTAGIGVSSLGTNLQTGYIPLSLWNARIINSNAIINTIEGGVVDGNTDPLVARVNGATDKQVRVVWAASNSAELQFEPIALPADFDGTGSAWSVKVLAAMAGATDVPTIIVGVFRGIGDSSIGGATGAVTGTTIAAYSKSVAASAGTTAAKPVSISIVPGAHTTDALYVYAAWIEYQRKS